MDKLEFMKLWDLYQPLLTPTQREITDMYFNLDLTTSEIAEQKGITRQAVSECLKTCKQQLADFEAKLGVAARIKESGREKERLAKGVEEWAKGFAKAHPEYSAEAEELSGIARGRGGATEK